MRAKMLGLALLPALALGPGACDDGPTTAVIENAFPAATAITVYKAWWVTTLFPDAVAPAASSATERTIPASDFAYALLAPGWSPGQGAPLDLIAVKSAGTLTASAHDLLTIVVDDTTFVGDCASGTTLTDEDARLIVERLFPGEFAGRTYDPATCATTPSGP